MRRRFKFKFLSWLLLYLPFQAAASGDWTESIRSIEESRKMIWDQLTQIEQQDDEDPSDKSVEFISSRGDSLLVSQALARKLLSIDSFGRMHRTDASFRGHHPVVCVHNLFFKSDLSLPSLDPMMETAVFFFHRLLFINGVAPSDFVFIKNVNVLRFQICDDEKVLQSVLNEQEEDFIQQHQDYQYLTKNEQQIHLLQISRKIDGERLDTFIKRVDEKIDSLDQLDLLNFQCHFITDLLLIPGDHKMENFIVERTACRNPTPSGVGLGKLFDGAVSGDSRTASLSGERISSFQGGVLQSVESKRLVNIDNDAMFFHFRVARNAQGFAEIQPFGGCKNVLFLFKPLMTQPINLQLRQKIIDLNPKDFLSTWLSMLEKQNQTIEEIFRKNPGFSDRYHCNHLPFYMPPKALARISYEISLIQTILKSNSSCSCQNLLEFLRPDLVNYYSWMLSQHGTYTKTLSKLYSNERPLACGQVANARIGPKPLKGRWIFQALNRYRNLRTQPLSESFKELQTPQMNIDEPLADRTDWKERLLKNSDDLSLRETISNEILYSLQNNLLPIEMLHLYPYDYVQEWVNRQPKKVIEQNLKSFILTSKVFEDYVFFIMDEPAHLFY
ncbi:MAG: hypothetical protein HW387_1464 [Parachlamydiales bacterium]|nr:hypothetical protein [Parachlamydiales bacterium]